MSPSPDLTPLHYLTGTFLSAMDFCWARHRHWWRSALRSSRMVLSTDRAIQLTPCNLGRGLELGWRRRP